MLIACIWVFHFFLILRLRLIINLCVEPQEERDQSDTIPASQAAENTVEFETNKKNVLVTAFIILDK